MPNPLTSAASPLPSADLLAAVPKLRRYARVLTGDTHRADDLVQDTLARAWEKRSLWQAGSDLRAWLFTIMHNLHVNQFARRRYEYASESLDAVENDAEISVSGKQFERVELSEAVARLSLLPVEQREVLVLAAVDGMSYDEIARALEIPVGTVMSRLHRARQKLREGK
jgi:RNA polymerase sigma-70 factor (ECF subfamily)